MKVNNFSTGTAVPNGGCSCICYSDNGYAYGSNVGAGLKTCGETCIVGNEANNAANLAYAKQR